MLAASLLRNQEQLEAGGAEESYGFLKTPVASGVVHNPQVLALWRRLANG